MLLGIVVGAVVAAAFGKMNFDKVASAPWFDWSIRSSSACRSSTWCRSLTMCIVMIVVMIESTGMFLALGEMTGKKIDQAALTRGPAHRRRSAR